MTALSKAELDQSVPCPPLGSSDRGTIALVGGSSSLASGLGIMLLMCQLCVSLFGTTIPISLRNSQTAVGFVALLTDGF